MPHDHEPVALGDTNQIGSRTFERRGWFDWPMDRFGLTVSYDGRQETIDVFGPYLATLARGYLTDETIPGVAVHKLAVAIAQLITGKAIDLSSIKSISAGFRAKETSEMCLAILTDFLNTHQSPGS